MTETDKPEEKLSVWCENCEEYIHSVDDIELNGQCKNCGTHIFKPAGYTKQ